jgi:hypothetical protein
MELVAPSTLNENDWLKGQLQAIPDLGSIWQAYTDSATEGLWKDPNDASLTFDPWHPGQPNGNGDCAQMEFQFQYAWNDIGCTNTGAFVCQAPKPPEATCVDSDGDGFGVGCVLGTDCADDDPLKNAGLPDICDGIDNDCSGAIDDDPYFCSCVELTDGMTSYLHCKGATDQYQAAGHCLAYGGELAQVDNLAEDIFLTQQVVMEGNPAYIGLNDIATEAAYVWQNGIAATYLNWATGEPSGSTSSSVDCVVILPDGTGWNDISCTNERDYICELP